MFRLARVFAPPRIADESKARMVPVLNAILWAGFALTLTYSVASIVLPPSPYLNIPIEIGIAVVHLLALAILHRGYPRIASWLYAFSLWLLVSTSSLSLGEVTSTGISSLFTVILIAGILLGPVGGFGLAALSTFAVIAHVLLVSGETITYDDWIPALTVALNFALIAVVAWLGERSISTSLGSASTSRNLLGRRSAQLEAAAEIGSATASSTDLASLLSAITQVIADRFGFYHVSILTTDKKAEKLVFSAISEGGEVTGKFPITLTPQGGRSIIAHVARTGKPYVATDVRTDPYYLDSSLFPKTRSEIAVPIFASGTLFGVLDVLSKDETPLGKDELNALQVLAQQIGAAVHGHALMDATNRHLEELTALHAIATAGNDARNEDEFLRAATEVVGRSLFPTNFGVLLLDEQNKVLRHHASYSESRAKVLPSIPLGEGITGLVAITGQPILVGDVSAEPKYISVDPRVRSELCVPLKIGDRVLGVLDLESHEVNSFTKADEALLLTLAGQIASSLERIRLLTDAQQRADELANTLKQQKELARMRDEFVQNVSHEFRTPLAVVSGYIEILESGEFGPLPAEYQQPVHIAARRVRSLGKLVDDLTALLDLAAHKSDFTVLRVADMLTPLFAEYRMKALSEQVELHMDLGTALPTVRAEETLLRKAIDNLVENAIKFTPPEGRVDIQLRANNDSLELAVKDTGVGIPPEELPRIFERFYQVDGSNTRRYGGTGLGLALVKEIVDLHQGELSVTSELGEGSTFTIKLPAA